MFYYLFDLLDKQFNFPGAGVFQYISFRAAMALIFSLLISMVFGKHIIGLLQKKQVGETVRDLGLHGQLEKKGTPTMGGLIIIAAILIPTFLFARLNNIYIMLMIVTTIWLGIIGFLDDNLSLKQKIICGIKVLGPLQLAERYPDACFVNGIGSPFNFWKKEEIIRKSRIPLERFEAIIHPSANVSKTARIGYGTVIFQNVTINSNVKIGHHVVVLPNSVISHDGIIENYTCIAAGVAISGKVKIGSLCYLGANSSIRGGLSVQKNSLIGMGSVVLTDVPENSVFVGNPAKFLRATIKK